MNLKIGTSVRKARSERVAVRKSLRTVRKRNERRMTPTRSPRKLLTPMSIRLASDLVRKRRKRKLKHLHQ
jgi:hypothetical protein